MIELKRSIKNINAAVQTIHGTLCDIKLASGDAIWVIMESGLDNSCDNQVKGKKQKYLERTVVADVYIIICDEDGNYTVTFTDIDGRSYGLSDINVKVFTDREEALNKL